VTKSPVRRKLYRVLLTILGSIYLVARGVWRQNVLFPRNVHDTARRYYRYGVCGTLRLIPHEVYMTEMCCQAGYAKSSPVSICLAYYVLHTS